MNEWKDEWKDEWMNEWMRERMNKWMNEPVPSSLLRRTWSVPVSLLAELADEDPE